MDDVSNIVARGRWVAGAVCVWLLSLAPIANAQPCEPTLVGAWQDVAGDDAHDVAVEGTLAVVADSVHGLRYLDVSDPANPTLLATQILHTQAGGVALCYGIDIHDGLVYVAAGGLHVIDATDPSAPVLLGQVEPDFSARDFLLQVRVVGGHAFCLGQTHGLQMFDVSDPSDPVWIGTVPSDQGGSEWAGFRSLIEHDGVLFYGAEDEGLYAVDVTGPDPEVLFVGYDHATEGVQSLGYDRGYLYVSGRWTQVFDARDPGDLAHLGWVYDESEYHSGVSVHAGFATVFSQNRGEQHAMVSVYDVRHPGAPARVAWHGDPTYAVLGEREHDGLVYAANGPGGLRIVDPGPCAACTIADLAADGTLNLDDVDAFIAGFLAGDPIADLDANGVNNLDDVDAFIGAFQAGCP